MKLSEQLKQDHDCGDFGQALEGYSEKAKATEDMLMDCIIDLYKSATGKFTKKTARKIMKYVADNDIDTINL